MNDNNNLQFRGTYIKREDFDGGKVLSVEERPVFEYQWSTGIAISRYFKGLKEGKLIGSECGKCGRKVIPPRIFCEWCFAPMQRFIELQDTGTIITFSICYIATDASRLKEPQIPAVIAIDGTTNDEMGILHLVSEVDPNEVKIGMRVKAVWKKESERTGAITDIKYFKPLK